MSFVPKFTILFSLSLSFTVTQSIEILLKNVSYFRIVLGSQQNCGKVQRFPIYYLSPHTNCLPRYQHYLPEWYIC